jgi:hypothetical protein
MRITVIVVIAGMTLILGINAEASATSPNALGGMDTFYTPRGFSRTAENHRALARCV